VISNSAFSAWESPGEDWIAMMHAEPKCGDKVTTPTPYQ
jgi:hypothetical protein